jgi:2-oxoglutarate dehydrogenase E1 component
MDAKDSLESQIANLAFLEEIYQQYQSNPQTLDPSWIPFFQRLESRKPIAPAILPTEQLASQAERIAHLVDAYRWYGHLLADINPIALEKPQMPDQLKLENLGFQASESEQLFPTLNLLPQAQAPLKAIVEILQKRYSQNVGFEFKGFTDPSIENWIQKQIESGRFEKPLSLEDQLVILDVLTRAEVLETFLHTKHVGKKRFSLEGAETLIPMLTLVAAKAADEGVEEFFIGMSHRGRLNVLANILNRPIPSILKDFDEDYVPAPSEGMGDIRYHKGHANESVTTYRGKAIKLTMAPNPSHLESVNPVVEGQTHAKQFLVGDEKERHRIIPLLMHGDAALAGQGVVYETLQMSKLPGFETGGTLHIVINNQIGFTTSPREGRSTLYCTDIAKTFGAPVFHVNADDPEMCVHIALFAYEIRQRFHCDVFIDLNCYRKYGHNEGDEPAFTQPLEYRMIRERQSIRTLYVDQLVQKGHIDKKVADEREETLRQHLQETYQASQEEKEQSQKQAQTSRPEIILSFPIVETAVDITLLREVTESFSKIPTDFHMNAKVKNLMQERYRAVFEDKPFDWGTAEFLAYGTLVWEGISVRLAGQDSGRGTFSHRHALWVDQENNQPYYPLAHLRQVQGRFEVLNTCLSEVAALGFEYGYSTVCTEGLTIWEAQFGDFANSAQVIIDQYIASGEQKWGQTSNLVLFLPHGFEGQGPEHSSARFERFLALAGHGNMQVINPTTPAQVFHLLRRQIKQPLEKPLIVLTPKGLLRHPVSVSRVKDLTEGHFSYILDDPRKPKQVRRLILCTGRIYYDLDAQREKEKRDDLAMIRIEQLYPLNITELKNIIAQYQGFQDCQWVQEEPENMGAWSFISAYLPQVLPAGIPFSYVGRERSASPATGFYARHKQELAHILHQVFKT